MIIHKLLEDLSRDRFYGSVELKFEAGKVVLVRKTESFKPSVDDYRIARGQANDKV